MGLKDGSRSVFRVAYEVFLVAISIPECRCEEVACVCVRISSDGRVRVRRGRSGWRGFCVERNVGGFDGQKSAMLLLVLSNVKQGVLRQVLHVEGVVSRKEVGM